jgi:hypothetical protein
MKQGFFARIKDPALRKAAQLALVLHVRPSEILALKGSETWLVEVDHTLVADELERMTGGSDVTVEEKKADMRKWKERQR